ncbi:MAG TPA: CocE/NonD family hydrolase [Rhizomicrobium sp.]
MKIAPFAALAAALSLLGLAQAADTPPAPNAAAAALPPASTLPFSEEFMTARDGVKLAANVYKPQGSGPWPVIVERTPYLKDGRMSFVAARYVKAGYVFVMQDVRGKGHSEGHYIAFANDIDDGYDTVEWIAKQNWSNGNIGMSGGSAMGITTNMAAIAAPPHLKAAYVIVAPGDMSVGTFINGAYKDKDNGGWLKMQGVSDEVIAAGRARATRNELAERNNIAPGLQYVRIPMYNVGGWYDIFEQGNIDNFVYLQNRGATGARGNQKLALGPFGHGPLSGGLSYPGRDNLFAMLASGDEEIRWFDYWLKGTQNGIMDEPPVSYFMMGPAEKGAVSELNRLLHAANWPVAHRDVRYYLTGARELSTAMPSAPAAKLSYRFDPAKPAPTVGGANLTFDRGPMDQRIVGQRADYIRFATPVLDKDVVVTGRVSLDLYAATDGPDTDFDAKLVDVYPDGYEALVLEAPMRARYRNGSLPDDIKMMTPGAPEKLTIDLWSTALTFAKGHRIALHITSSNSPRFDVNPNNGDLPGLGTAKPRVATNTIYFDKDHPSALVLPIVYPEQ